MVSQTTPGSPKPPTLGVGGPVCQPFPPSSPQKSSPGQLLIFSSGDLSASESNCD
eukprot:jgi/Botrbrau1/226/Bobra.0022s0205.1